MDFKGKTAVAEFDEGVISVQEVARAMSTTPHMMSRDMQYGGVLVLSVAGVKDANTGKKASSALRKVPGVANVTLFPPQDAVGVEFAGKGKATSQQLLDALKTAGFQAAQYVWVSEPRDQAMNGGNASMPDHAGMAMANGAMAGHGMMGPGMMGPGMMSPGMMSSGMMGQGMTCGCGSPMQMTSPGLRYGITASARGGCGCR